MPELRDQLQLTLGEAYRVQRELGGGGMSRVFVARDVALGRDVVVKVLSPELAATVSVDRFRREILLAATLQHPHIIGVLGTGELDGLPYFTMPYVDGESLRHRLQQEGRLTVGETVSVLRDVARALAYAHERGVVHRDIKPDNILLSGGSAAVTDFGVAKAIESARPAALGSRYESDSASREPQSGSHTITLVGTSLGTPEYMAPEQAAADPNVDGRADIYALGITAYEMLTGTSPFRGRPPQQLLAAQLTEVPPPLATHRTDVPHALALLVARCLEKDPARRPQSAAELASALSDPAVVSGAFVSAAVPTVEHPAWRAVRRAPMSRRLVALGLAVAAVAGGAWALRKPTAGVAAVGAAASPAAAVAAAVATPAPNSVAVLPFVNIGRDSTDAYLADGITAELTAALGRLPGVRVASPSAVASLKQRPSSLDSLGRTLHVALLLEGTTQRAGNRLRVTARLVNAADGFMLWSDVREHALTDVFAVQDEIARALADALGAELASSAPDATSTGQPDDPAARALDRERGTTNAAAYDAYLRGRHAFQKRGDAALQQAVKHFREAIAKDPGYALAHAGLAETYALLPTYGTSPYGPSVAQALAASERAVTLDSARAEVWGARGAAMLAAWRWAEAEASFRRAVAVDARYAEARQWLGEVLLLRGRVADGMVELRRAAELEPSSPIVTASYAHALGLAGRRAEAMAMARRAVSLDSSVFVPRLVLGSLHLVAREPSEAVRELRIAAEYDTSAAQVRGYLGYALAALGDREAARSMAGVLAARPDAAGHAGAIAIVHLGLGDTAQALGWLERAAVRRDPLFSTESLAEPVFDALRGSARFAALVRQVGLDPALSARR